jgi:hypothetical protein
MASSGLVSTRAYASTTEVPLADTLRSIEASRFRNKVEDAIPPNVDGPMLTCGVWRPVMLTDAEPASVMLGPAETVTTVAFRERMRQGEFGRDKEEDRTTGSLIDRASGRAALRTESGRDVT